MQIYYDLFMICMENRFFMKRVFATDFADKKDFFLADYADLRRFLIYKSA